MPITLPLFPLNTVLFPGGRLQLRVFEPRYIDLVRRCGRSGYGFGICRIESGDEVGAPAIPATVGTEAVIVDFAQTNEGLLSITIEGRRRFSVAATQVQNDGLVVAEATWLSESESLPLPVDYALLSVLLERILDRAGVPADPHLPQLLQRAEWVAWRLAEWLPLDDDERQRLLENDDVSARLQELILRLPEFQAE